MTRPRRPAPVGEPAAIRDLMRPNVFEDRSPELRMATAEAWARAGAMAQKLAAKGTIGGRRA